MTALLSIAAGVFCSLFPCRRCPSGWVDFGSPRLAICELPVDAIWVRGPRGGWVDASDDEISFAFGRQR